MKKQIEKKWVIFLFIILVTAIGLLTGFALSESLDIQMHDTYLVIDNLDLLVMVGLTLTIAYFITLGLKRLANFGKPLKITSTLIAGLFGLIL